MYPVSNEQFAQDRPAAVVRRVLVVDDSRAQRRIIMALLRRLGCELREAESGAAAMEVCRVWPPDLVISDWMMPGMDGLEFCRAFRRLARDGYGYFILLTSKSGKEEIALGLDAGADDFLTKPVDAAELRARISAGGRILRMQRELSEKNRVISETLAELTAIHEQIDQDLVEARKIQESLIPQRSFRFGASAFELLLEPCGHIGGDLVGLFSPGLNQVGFYSIDVSGHGITSALMTARLAGYLSNTHFEENVAMKQRQFAFYGLRHPIEVARILNARLMAVPGIDEYFTMVCGTIDLYTGRTEMVQCGHPHPLLLRADGRTQFLGQGGMPVGLLDDMVCDAFSVTLEPGDKLLLYSDGLTECRTANGDLLGEEALVAMLVHQARNGSARAVLEGLFRSLSDGLPKNAGFEDDISALLLDYRGV